MVMFSIFMIDLRYAGDNVGSASSLRFIRDSRRESRKPAISFMSLSPQYSCWKSCSLPCTYGNIRDTASLYLSLKSLVLMSHLLRGSTDRYLLRTGGIFVCTSLKSGRSILVVPYKSPVEFFVKIERAIVSNGMVRTAPF